MHVAHADALFVEVFGKVFGHALGQGGDEHAHAARRDGFDFAEQIVHLLFGRTNYAGWIDQPRRADHLLDEGAARALHFPAAGRRRHEYGVRAHRFPFLEFQGTVIGA